MKLEIPTTLPTTKHQIKTDLAAYRLAVITITIGTSIYYKA